MPRKHPKRRREAYGPPLRAAVLEHAAAALELPRDFAAGMAHVELSGNREAVVEGACTLLDYDEGSIRLRAGKCTLRFTGRGLCMRVLRKDMVIVEGYLLSVEYL